MFARRFGFVLSNIASEHPEQIGHGGNVEPLGPTVVQNPFDTDLVDDLFGHLPTLQDLGNRTDLGLASLLNVDRLTGRDGRIEGRDAASQLDEQHPVGPILPRIEEQDRDDPGHQRQEDERGQQEVTTDCSDRFLNQILRCGNTIHSDPPAPVRPCRRRPSSNWNDASRSSDEHQTASRRTGLHRKDEHLTGTDRTNESRAFPYPIWPQELPQGVSGHGYLRLPENPSGGTRFASRSFAG